MQAIHQFNSYNLWRLYAAGHLFGQTQSDAGANKQSSKRRPESRKQSRPVREEPRHSGLEEAYRILGCTPASDDREVRSAFRQLAKKWHPDCSKEPRELTVARFRKIRAAYEAIFAARTAAA